MVAGLHVCVHDFPQGAFRESAFPADSFGLVLILPLCPYQFHGHDNSDQLGKIAKVLGTDELYAVSWPFFVSAPSAFARPPYLVLTVIPSRDSFCSTWKSTTSTWTPCTTTFSAATSESHGRVSSRRASPLRLPLLLHDRHLTLGSLSLLSRSRLQGEPTLHLERGRRFLGSSTEVRSPLFFSSSKRSIPRWHPLTCSVSTCSYVLGTTTRSDQQPRRLSRIPTSVSPFLRP